MLHYTNHIWELSKFTIMDIVLQAHTHATIGNFILSSRNFKHSFYNILHYAHLTDHKNVKIIIREYSTIERFWFFCDAESCWWQDLSNDVKIKCSSICVYPELLKFWNIWTDNISHHFYPETFCKFQFPKDPLSKRFAFPISILGIKIFCTVGPEQSILFPIELYIPRKARTR